MRLLIILSVAVVAVFSIDMLIPAPHRSAPARNDLSRSFTFEPVAVAVAADGRARGE